MEDLQSDFDEYGDDLSFEVIDTINDETEIEKEYEWMEEFGSRDRSKGYNYKDQHSLAKKPEPIKEKVYKPMSSCTYRASLIGNIVCEISEPDADTGVVEMVESILRRDREWREGKI